MKSGEVFDQAILIGLDERRDVACVKIAATNLAYLEPGTSGSVQPGEVAYAVTNSGGLSWSATQGIFSALRLADEVPGAGQLRSAKTAVILSRTMYFTPETLERELARQGGYEALGLVLVKDKRVADLLITVDRPLFTYTFTYAVTDAKGRRNNNLDTECGRTH